jgi:hypothetical protein
MLQSTLLRKSLSILLLAVFGLPFVSPLLDMTAGAESNLPACCRRNGAHHCMMSEAQKQALLHGDNVTVIRTRCPLYPKATAPAHHPDYGFTPAAVLFTEVLSAPETLRQIEAWARIALEGARQKRGPPNVRLS